MAMKKGLLIGIAAGLLGCGLLVVGIVFLAFFLTRGPVEAADRFLALLGEGKVREAYASAAGGLRSSTPEEQFAASVRRWKLTDYRSSSWHSRQVHGRTGHVEGAVTTRDGTVIPLRINLVQEDQAWKVVALEPLQGVGAPPGAAIKLPADEEARALVRQTLLDFNRAVQDRDFTAFHGGIAELWKKEISPQGLQKVFQSFLDNRVDLGGIADLVPVLEGSPREDERGRLVVAGHYATMPSRVSFRLEYASERGAWKLAGIQVNVK